MGKFKNAAAAEIIEVLDRHKAAFEERKRGQDWRAIIATVGFVFPEDRITITGMFYQPYEGPKGVKVGAKDATPPAAPTGTEAEYKPCDGCPQEIKMLTKGPSVMAERAGSTAHLRTTEGVLAAFQGDLPILMRHAKVADIKLGRRNKPETVAEAIAQHYAKLAVEAAKAEEE